MSEPDGELTHSSQEESGDRPARFRRRWKRRLIGFGVIVVTVVVAMIGLRALSMALWNYDDAPFLPAEATELVPAGEPVEERTLVPGLVLSKFTYSVHGTRLNVLHHVDDNDTEVGPRPTLVMINGGAWHTGDEDTDLWYAQGWAEHGYTVVTIAHRPSTEVSFPGPTEDVLAGLEFALALDDSYGIDPDRLAFLGGSSGAHLATYTGYRLGETHPELGVRAVVSIFGPTDFRFIADDHQGGTWYRAFTLFYTPELGATTDINRFLGCNLLRRDCRDPIVQASPITYVDESTPPTLIIQGKRDQSLPWPQAIRLADALEAAGVEMELILDPEMGHQLDPDYLDDITDFLDANFE